MVRILQMGGGGGAPGPVIPPGYLLIGTWAWYKPITIAAGKVPSTQTNCPMVIDLADLGADFFAAVRTDGGGIRVTLPDKTLIPTELETIDVVANTGILHCKPPTLASLDVLRVYYGNLSPGIVAPDDAIGSQAVWDASYKMVQHLPNGTVLTANDSTSNGNNGVITGAIASAGKIDGGASLAGVSDKIVIANNSSLSLLAVEISAWINIPSYQGTREPICGKYYDGNAALSEYVLWVTPTGAIQLAGNGTDALTGGVIPLGVSKHVRGVINGAASAIYIDNVLAVSGTVTGNTNQATDLMIGAYAFSTDSYFKGIVDELRIEALRSADWDTTQYNNQSSPSTFYTVGAAVAA